MHPSVLLSVSTPLSPPSSSSREQLPPLSASGFILGEDGNGDILVVTTTSWLTEVLDILLSGNEAREDWLAQEPQIQFTVLVQTSNDSTVKTEVMSASLLTVCLMKEVLVSLTSVFNSLSHWRVTIGDDTAAITESLLLPLSCLALLKLTTPPAESSISRKLCFTAMSPAVGEPVVAIGTRFGAVCPEVFYNCQSPGTVCKVLDDTGEVFVTDANLSSGSEGSLIVTKDSATLAKEESVSVIGMIIAGLSSSNGVPSGLSLVCGAASIWRALNDSGVMRLSEHFSESLIHQPTLSGVSGVCDERVVLVKSGWAWGSGLVLSHTTILTCHHVTKSSKDITVCTQGGKCLPAEVVFSSSVPDCALLKLTTPLHSRTLVPEATLSNNQSLSRLFQELPHSLEGRSVTVTGYGCEDPIKLKRFSPPLVTKGHVIKEVYSGDRVVMLITTAVLLPGMSGGLVTDVVTGEPLGMAISNTREPESGVRYSKLNYCLPLSWLLPPLLRYLATNDCRYLDLLKAQGKDVLNIWNFNSNSLTSKL